MFTPEPITKHFHYIFFFFLMGNSSDQMKTQRALEPKPISSEVDMYI